ncbi:hypothetical protein QAD02_008080 [Eretmocerus hayati]|uniref:Uncharacterized protein n=1 Tax=Eretmocerus hayati TaxID=131215 RepID=A0ACC2N636_9HYME|nr:hypothetical protein QAD02_008080 [Eretmocerus hayati]
MNTLLKTWGFEDLAPCFRENEMKDLDDLGDLIASPSDFAQVVPKIGLRFQISRKYNAGLQNVSVTKTQTELPPRDPLHPCDTSDDNVSHSPLAQIENDGTPDGNQPEQIIEEIFIESETVEKNSSNQSQPKVLVIEAESPAKKAKFCRTKDFDIEKVLIEYPLGRCIIIQYQVFGYLEVSHQTLLVQIITIELLRLYGKNLNDADLELVAEKIYLFFHNEAVAIYFLPPVLKEDSKNDTSVKSRGKLRDKYRNWITFINRHENYEKCATAQQIIAVIAHEGTQLLEQAMEKKNELLTEKDPTKMLQIWDETMILGAEDRENNEFPNGTKVCESWPKLKEEDSFDLLSRDYGNMYPNAVQSLEQVFNDVSQKIMHLFKANSSTPDERKFYHGLLKNKDSFSKMPGAPKNIKVDVTGINAKKKKFWKPTCTEARKGLVTHAKDEKDIPGMLAMRTAKLVAIKQPPLPFIIAVGEDLAQLKKFYVRLDSAMYKASSLLTALDMLMKISLVLHIRYPLASENICYSLQWGIYKINREGKQLISAVYNVLNRLKLPCQHAISH